MTASRQRAFSATASTVLPGISVLLHLLVYGSRERRHDGDAQRWQWSWSWGRAAACVLGVFQLAVYVRGAVEQTQRVLGYSGTAEWTSQLARSQWRHRYEAAVVVLL